MAAVIAILQVDDRLADEVVGADQIPVVDLHRQLGVQGEGGLDLKAPGEEVGSST